MATNLMTVSADGIETYEGYLSILREHVDDLTANGMEYEEQDRRAEPVTATLLVNGRCHDGRDDGPERGSQENHQPTLRQD